MVSVRDRVRSRVSVRVRVRVRVRPQPLYAGCTWPSHPQRSHIAEHPQKKVIRLGIRFRVQ